MGASNFQVHKSSIVGKNAKIGQGTKIWHFCNVMDGAEVGDNCNIGQNSFIEAGVKIGNNVTVKNNIAIYTGVVCEDNVFLGPNVVFTNILTPRSFVSRKNEFNKTLIKFGATLGANCTIICGNTVGRFALVGAGAVVTKDVSDHALVVGNPAKIIGYVCECGERIDKTNYSCLRCKINYNIIDEKIIKI